MFFFLINSQLYLGFYLTHSVKYRFIPTDVPSGVRLHHIAGLLLFFWSSWKQNTIAHKFAKLRQNKDGKTKVNPYLTNGFSHHYLLGVPTFILRDIRGDFGFLFHFSMKFL